MSPTARSTFSSSARRSARLAIDGASLVLDTTTEFGRVPILQAPADGASRFTAVELWTTGARFTAVIAAP